MYLIFLYVIKIVICIVGLIFATILGLKLYFEPKAGVCKCKTRLDGKTVLVTGGNSGIGFETAKDLANRGAKVIIADVNNADQAVTDIIKSTGNDNVEYRHLNLADFSNIVKFAEDINKTVDKIDILVNNAGTGHMKDTPTKDGLNIIMQVNYIGHFLLTALLLDKLIASKPSRIIIVASDAYKYAQFDLKHISGLSEKVPYLMRYANSKLCEVLWMKELAKRLPPGVTVNAVHPGVVRTNIFNKVPYIKGILLFVIDIFFKSPKMGAQTSIHLCASSDLEYTSGKYYADCKIKDFYNEGKNDVLAEKVWRETISVLIKYFYKVGERYHLCDSISFE